jgi:hypothetical protein
LGGFSQSYNLEKILIAAGASVPIVVRPRASVAANPPARPVKRHTNVTVPSLTDGLIGFSFASQCDR